MAISWLMLMVLIMTLVLLVAFPIVLFVVALGITGRRRAQAPRSALVNEIHADLNRLEGRINNLETILPRSNRPRPGY